MSEAIYCILVLLMVIVNGGHADFGADTVILTLPFEYCDSILDVKSVRISSCAPDSDPCEIPTNAVVDVDIGFENFTMPFRNDEKEDVEHSAKWVLNEVQTDAEVLPNDTDNRMALTKATLKIGDLASDIRGKLRWKTIISGEVVACFSVPIILVENSSDSETPPLPMPN